ncbi:MAG: DinB family protein [Bacteroidia bacterium]|nr:DinB family protein [Bacteroidia bacterium]
MNRKDPGRLLREITLSVKPQLLAFTDTEAFQKPAADKWSPKEIIGHLIDSASNNHQRFVRAQFKRDMIFEGYKQEKWVIIQHYQKRSWNELVEMWVQYNLQLSHLMIYTPRELSWRPVSEHNLHQIAFKRIPAGEVTSLAYFMVDYVAHLEHHLCQILPDYQAVLEAYENNFYIKSI